MPTKLNQVYKCSVCGNIVEVVHTGAGQLVCCGMPMQLQDENTTDAATEKHVPVVETKENGELLVKVGEVDHPMEEAHYIEWIEVTCELGTFKYFLKPTDKPEAKFFLGNTKEYMVRAYCNLHGLWKKE